MEPGWAATNWTAIGAVAETAATIVAATAIAFVWWQIKKEGLRHSADLILQLRGRYHEPDIKKIRARAAKDILTGNDGKSSTDTRDLLNFFDRIGLLVHRGVLDKTMVWNAFFQAVHRYCAATERDLIRLRERRPNAYEELLYLLKELGAVQRRKEAQMAKKLVLQSSLMSGSTTPERKEEFFTLEGLSRVKKPDKELLNSFLLHECSLLEKSDENQ